MQWLRFVCNAVVVFFFLPCVHMRSKDICLVTHNLCFFYLTGHKISPKLVCNLLVLKIYVTKDAGWAWQFVH